MCSRPRPRAGTAGRTRAIPDPAGAPSPAWIAVDRLDGLPAGALVGAEVGRSRLVVANVDGTLLAYRDSCAGCGGELHTGGARGRRAALPAVRADVLPAARGPLDGRRPHPARAGAAPARERDASWWRWRRDRERRQHRRPGARSAASGAPLVAEAVAARRRAQVVDGPPRPGAARAGRRRAGRRAGGVVRPLPHEHPVGPPPPAAPRGAADRVRLRELLGASVGRCGVPADGQPHGVAARRGAARRRMGQLSDPHRARVLHGLDHRRVRRRALSEPRRARPRASCTSRRGAGWSS